ncbi:MAG TPA: hypothetical protein VG297_13490 [Bryobacteraceae bacterium]|jgi:hypothetical protein|nr:hypothetical protein [Bryobacteraceae bacterium]
MRTKYLVFCLILATPLGAQITSRSSSGSASRLSAPSLGAGASPLSETWTVGAGGVTASTLAQTDNSAPLKIVAATTGSYGVALGTAAAGQTVEVARYGTVNCLADTGGATAGHLAVIGTGTVIYCRDSGQTASASIPIGTLIVGVFRSSAGAGVNALVELTPDHYGTQVTGGGGGGAWGSITGTLSSQTDLQTALNGKQASLGYTAESTGNKDAASGYAGLDAGGKLKASEAPNWTAFPAPGTSVTLSGNSEIFVCTGACTVSVPVPSAGVQYCVVNDDNASSAITLSALGSAAMYETQGRTGYGTAGTGTMVSSGQAGDSICIVGRDSTHYLTVASTGSWTAN